MIHSRPILPDIVNIKFIAGVVKKSLKATKDRDREVIRHPGISLSQESPLE